MIRTLTHYDYEHVKGMVTNIEDDYIIRIFSHLVEQDLLVGYFINSKLVGLAGLTIFEDEVAILGRLRTHVRYRGKGIATSLMEVLIDHAYKSDRVKWVGYATEKDNLSANSLSSKLNMVTKAEIISARVSPGTVIGVDSGGPFKKIDSLPSKQRKLAANAKESQFTFFPYAIYYPLPYIPDLSDLYISNIEMYSSKAGDFFLMRDEKGASYLHLKLFDLTLLKSKAMWKIVNRIAHEEQRTIWLDLPASHEDPLNDFQKTHWHLIGRERELEI